MPQISKVRIVNFRYNDGKRLIADELFDFSDKESSTAKNVLLNLANGGGKSVLVQLMMQPVIPKAKVAGRKIESFFSKSSDHCFVLLEWIKDNSTEKLMTGIAMSASESTATEDDSTRGMSVKYYTFYSNYQNYQNHYNIISLPLSKRDNGRFIPADFDSVRTIAKKSSGAIEYYASDDNPLWQRKLLEYGINWNEWRMIEQLNSEEGGLTKFFGDFKNSDAVVDKLLIPRIESQSTQSGNKEDSSLTTMMISFARKFGQQREIIRERDALKAYYDELIERKKEAGELWSLDDKVKQALAALFAFSDALERKIDSCITEEEILDGVIEQSKKSIWNIQYEKASFDFYEALEKYIFAQKNAQQATAEAESVQKEHEEAQMRVLLLECANYYQKLRTVENEIAGLQSAIVEKESNEQEGRKLAVLKYSAYVAIEKALSEENERSSTLKARRAEAEEELEAASKERIVLQKEKESSQTALDKENGRLDSAYEETDKAVTKVGFEIFRRLDGSYGNDEIAEEKEKRDNDAQAVSQERLEYEGKRETCQNEKDAIPQQVADLKLEIGRLDTDCANVEKAISEYDEAEKAVLAICWQYNLDPAERFTDSIKHYLDDEIRNAQSKEAALVYKIAIAEESIRAVDNSAVHVPKAVMDYLNQTGVRYQTCEQYLLSQVDSGTMTAERCMEILKKYPAVAFGIMMDESEKDRFFSYGREEWLPAMVPLFTPSQMNNVLSIQEDRKVAIAFFSEEYFSDKEHYTEKKKKQLDALLSEQSLLHDRVANLRAQVEIVNRFSYPEDWKAKKEASRDEIKKAIASAQSEVTALLQRSTKLEAGIADLIEKLKALAEEERKYSVFCDDYIVLLDRIEAENKLQASVAKLKNHHEEAEEKHLRSVRREKDAADILERIRKDADVSAATLSELEKAVSEVTGAAETELIEGVWTDLLVQYRQLQESQSAALKTLRDNLHEKENRAEEYRSELKKRNCAENQYSAIVYSEVEEAAGRNNTEQLSGRLAELRKKVSELTKAEGKAEGIKDSAEKALNIYAEEPLDKSKIGVDFSSRINDENKRQTAALFKKRKVEELRKGLERISARVTDELSDKRREGIAAHVSLDEDYKAQYAHLLDEWKRLKTQFEQRHADVKEIFERVRSCFSGKFYGSGQALDGLCHLLNDKDIRGDRYFTLSEQIEANQKTVQLQISKIETDLAEFDHSREDLIHQCVTQGQRIYEGLKQMMQSSRVRVYQGKGNQQMLKLDIPDDVDPNVARSTITAEISIGTEELSSKITANTVISDADLRKEAEKIVGSKKLFRKYIGKDSIVLKAYKIDQNPENAGYRTWEQTQVNNSGAEKFVVYFAIILSLMNYSRSNSASINDRAQLSTLILDNPFGPISSAHVLEPMFAIAKHFRVQMICLSDISKQDILNCFDLVIKAVIKQRAFSNVELLTHDGNEVMEHGFYRSEQISMF
ncbi:MAG: hypothetical protein MJ137_03320 [Clostridia bacterium]|nr:hypothetical protein [Clostridia bacterium]